MKKESPTRNSQPPTPAFDPGLLVVALLALFAAVPLLAHPGLPNTADGPAHLMRQAELNQAWQDGVFYPRWAPDLAYGHGMPLFHYAPPLLYHVSQLFHLTGPPLDVAMKGTIITMMVLYSVGMYLFARDVYGPRAGLLAAAVYLYAPYRLREAYIQGNYGQFSGLAFYPVILWSFHGLIASGRRRYLPPAALSLAGLLLSHNISAMIFAPLFGAYVVFLLALRRSEAGRMEGWKLVAAIGLGLGLSAFFWLPAFGERDLIRLSGITTGFFDFRYNFISLGELLALPRPLDLAAVNPYFPLSLGTAQLVFAVLALLGLVLYYVLRFYALRLARTHAMRHTTFFAVALLVTLFLTLPFSRPLWETVPLLELAEFPWRWLGPALLCAAALAGGVFYMFEAAVAARTRGRLELDAGRLTLVALGISLVTVIAVNLVYLFPSQFIPWGTPTPADAVAYEAESRAIGTTSAGEFLPRWADRFPVPETLGPDYAAGRLPAVVDPASLPDGASATTLARTARETRLAVSSPVPFTATFRALYWPDWRVVVASGGADGDAYQISDVEITRPDGLIRAPLPAGEYQVSLRLFPTPIRRAATVISVLAMGVFLGLVLMWLLGWKDGRLKGWKDGWLEGWLVGQPSGSGSSNLPIFQAVILGAALIVGLLVTRPVADWFRVRSPLDVVYGAQYEVRADFGDRVRLLAYDVDGWKIGWLDGWMAGVLGGDADPNLPVFQSSSLPAIQGRAGSSLPVVLYWRALDPLTDNYSVFVHLDAPDGTTYASADELNPADIPTSRWPPSLYVRNPLTLALPPELPPIRYTLTAGLYDPDDGARLPVTGCEGCPVGGGRVTGGHVDRDALPLGHVWVTSAAAPSEGDIPNRLDFRLGDHIVLLGYELTGTDPAELTLYWRAEGPVGSGFTVFIHALDGEGETLAQFDAPPLNGLYPSDAWMPGQVIPDVHSLALPRAARELAIGLYDPATLTRLPVVDGDGERVYEDAVRVEVR